jgi:Cytochrome c554 and c-prime
MPVIAPSRRRAVSPAPAALLLFTFVALLGLVPAVARADISGSVLVDGSGSPGTPVPGAAVHLQADPASPVVFAAADGSFTLPVSPAGAVIVTAAVTYDRSAPVNFNTAGALAFDGQTGVEIRLPQLPAGADPAYVPAQAGECGSCHKDQFTDWGTSNHSFGAVDTWVLDLFSGTGTPGGGAGYVFRDLHDAGDTGFCATCHAPLADVFDPGGVLLDEVTGTAALQGVTCVACHQVDSVDENVDALHLLGNATYRFPDAGGTPPTERFVWGPLDDVSFDGMRASHAPVFESSRFCASCHQYVNPTTLAPGQNTYREWLASPYAAPGPGYRSCQDCHMPEPPSPATVCIIGDAPARDGEQVRHHTFVGATPGTLAASIGLATTAGDAGGRLTVASVVDNFGAGHSFPSGVSVRNALLVIEASWNGQPLAQVAGPQVPFWADDDVPGKQPGDYAGEAGKGFAKVLEGRINGSGPVEMPVLFIDAEGVYSDTLIPADSTDTTEVQFQLPPEAQPGDVVDVSARLLYRRAYRATAVTKGWTETPQGGPVEIEVAADQLAVTLTQGGAGVLEIPALGARGMIALAVALALAGLALLRPRG